MRQERAGTKWEENGGEAERRVREDGGSVWFLTECGVVRAGYYAVRGCCNTVLTRKGSGRCSSGARASLRVLVVTVRW